LEGRSLGVTKVRRFLCLKAKKEEGELMSFSFFHGGEGNQEKIFANGGEEENATGLRRLGGVSWRTIIFSGGRKKKGGRIGPLSEKKKKKKEMGRSYKGTKPLDHWH